MSVKIKFIILITVIALGLIGGIKFLEKENPPDLIIMAQSIDGGKTWISKSSIDNGKTWIEEKTIKRDNSFITIKTTTN